MSKNLNRTILLLTSPFVFLSKVYAEDPPEINSETIDKLVNTITSRLLPIAGLLSFIFIVYGAYMWIMSAGDPDKIKKAQGTLQLSLIHISEPTRLLSISYAVFCLKKKNK